MRSALVLAGSLALLAQSAARADQQSLPNSILTPGAIDPAATRDVVCNGTTRGRRHVTMAMKAEVLAAYNIPDIDSPNYEMDHLVPGSVSVRHYPGPGPLSYGKCLGYECAPCAA